MPVNTSALKSAVDTALPNAVVGVAPIGAAQTRTILKSIIDQIAGWIDANVQPSTEDIQDAVGAFLSGSTLTNITATYDDNGNKMNIAVPTGGAGGLDAEAAQDMIGGGFLVQGTNITLVYNDATNQLTISAAWPGAATQTVAGLMSPTDKTKLDGLANASWNAVTASATTGTATVALGANPISTCDITTTGNLVANVTAAGRSRLLLRVTIGTAGHTLVLQYAGATTNVRFRGLNPLSSAQIYPTAVNTVIYFDIQTDGTNLDVLTWYTSISGMRRSRTQSVTTATGAMVIDMAAIDDYFGFWTLTGNVTSLAILNARQGQGIYLRAEQGGAGSFTITFPTSTPNVAFPSAQAVSWNTAAGSVNTFAMIAHSPTRLDAQSTKY